MATPVTPVAALVTTVAVGGTAVTVFPENINGGFITNPSSASSQGLGEPENLFVSPVGPAALVDNDITFVLEPGETWTAIPGQTTRTTANAASTGHNFTAVYW